MRWGGAGAATATIALLVTGALGLPLAILEGAGRRRAIVPWALVACLGVTDAGNAGCYFLALARGATAPAVLCHYVAPVMVAVAAPMVLREPRSRRTPLALLLALAGTALIVAAGKPTQSGSVSFAVLFGGLSAIFYAANVLLSRILTPHFGNSELLSYHALVSAALLAAITGVPFTQAAWTWVGLGGAVSAFGAGLLFYVGLRRMPTERASILCYIEPLAAVIIGRLVLSEPIAPLAAAGGCLVLAGGLLVAAR